jgi:Zn-finger nucleic acid-binding protein
MASGELQRILQHHDEVFTPEEIASVQGVNKEIFTAEKDDHDELDCPQCTGIRMEHFNYGDTSGIILHKCLQCGGVWMDKDELLKVEEVVDGWKGCLNEDIAKYGPILDKIDKQEEAELEKDVSISRFGFVNSILRHFTQ